jgi:hypothetical protein
MSEKLEERLQDPVVVIARKHAGGGVAASLKS